jgi:hypothetical protein
MHVVRGAFKVCKEPAACNVTALNAILKLKAAQIKTYCNQHYTCRGAWAPAGIGVDSRSLHN